MGKAIVQGHDKAAALPLDHRAHGLARGDSAIDPAHRIVHIDFVAEDIDPVQQLVVRIPNGPFADERVLFHD